MFCGALSFQLVIESSYHDYPSNENASHRPIVVTGFRMCLQMWLRKWTDPMITISTPRKLDVVSFASLFSPTNSLYNAMHSMKGNPFFLPHSYQISVLQWQDNHWTDESHFVGNFFNENIEIIVNIRQQHLTSHIYWNTMMACLQCGCCRQPVHNFAPCNFSNIILFRLHFGGKLISEHNLWHKVCAHSYSLNRPNHQLNEWTVCGHNWVRVEWMTFFGTLHAN